MSVETDPVQQILADSATASDAFFKSAEDVFAARGQAAPATPAVVAPVPAVTPVAPAAGSKIPAFPSGATPATPDSGKGQPSLLAASSATTSPADDDIPREYRPGSMQKVHWEKLHSLKDEAVRLRDAAIARAELLEKQAARAPSPDTDTRLATLQQEKEAAIAELERVAVERSPRFEAQFKPRVEAAIALAKSAAPFDKGDRIAQLLAMPDSEYRNTALEEVAKELTGLKAGRFASAVAEVDKIANERAAAAANSRTTFAAWQAEEAAHKQAAHQTRLNAATSTLSTELANFGNFFKGDAPEVKERAEVAKSVFLGGLPYPDLARAAAWSAIGPSLASQNSALLTEVASLKGDLVKLRGAQPGGATDAGHAAASGEPALDENLSYGDAIGALVSGQNLLR